MNNLPPNKGLLWIARTWAGLIVGVLIFIGIGEFMEEIKNHSPRRW